MNWLGRVIFSPPSGLAMLITAVGIAFAHGEWTTAALFLAGMTVMYVYGSTLPPGARP